METTSKRRTQRRSPYLSSPCRACGHDTLVTPCTRPGCDRWLSVCGGCLDEIARFIETDGRCPWCRVQ